MSDYNRTGGPAFPVANDAKADEAGMTLRDWFAGQALVGLAASNARVDASVIADACYLVADAMLQRRTK